MENPLELDGAAPENLHQRRIEMPWELLQHHRDRRGVRQSRFVHAAGAQGIVDVGDCDDAGRQRNAVARQMVGITLAIVAFVVVPCNLAAHLQKHPRETVLPSHLLQRAAADGGVGLHDGPFFWRQLARFQQDVVGQAHFADVVQWSTALQHFDEIGVNLRGKGRRTGRFFS